MDIVTKTVTTKVHTATTSLDALKDVAVTAVKKQLGLSDGDILSTSAEIGADGAVKVEVVQAVAEVQSADESPAPPPPASAPVPPVLQPII